MTLLDRFEAKFTRGSPEECWLWTGALNPKGYGQIRVGRKTDGTSRTGKAHRVSWELHHGPIPDGDGAHGTCVLHRCDNPGCVNPAHLFLGTQAENLTDMKKKSRGRNGGLRGEASGNAKLTEKEVVEIRALHGKTPPREIAARFGITQQQVSNIIRGKRWAHLEGSKRSRGKVDGMTLLKAAQAILEPGKQDKTPAPATTPRRAAKPATDAEG